MGESGSAKVEEIRVVVAEPRGARRGGAWSGCAKGLRKEGVARLEEKDNEEGNVISWDYDLVCLVRI